MWKGKKMPGRMGGDARTVNNVWLYKVREREDQIGLCIQVLCTEELCMQVLCIQVLCT